MTSALFIFFTLMIVLPVLYMIVTKNVVRAVFSLVVALLGIAAMYVLLSAELMAVVQLMLYAGGIIVLMVFGVMLTKRLSPDGVMTTHRGVFVGVIVGLVFFGLLMKWIMASPVSWAGQEAVEVDQVQIIGIAFLTEHLLSFEIIAYLLLVALVGAAFLAKRSEVS